MWAERIAAQADGTYLLADMADRCKYEHRKIKKGPCACYRNLKANYWRKIYKMRIRREGNTSSNLNFEATVSYGSDLYFNLTLWVEDE
jgi:hypothetical protein